MKTVYVQMGDHVVPLENVVRIEASTPTSNVVYHGGWATITVLNTDIVKEITNDV